MQSWIKREPKVTLKLKIIRADGTTEDVDPKEVHNKVTFTPSTLKGRS
jgi:hypothetical protein